MKLYITSTAIIILLVVCLTFQADHKRQVIACELLDYFATAAVQAERKNIANNTNISQEGSIEGSQEFEVIEHSMTNFVSQNIDHNRPQLANVHLEKIEITSAGRPTDKNFLIVFYFKTPDFYRFNGIDSYDYKKTIELIA